MTQPTLVLMIGPPACGKTTFRNSHIPDPANQDITVLSSDDFIEEYAAKEGKTYDQVYKQYIKKATSRFKQEFRSALNANKNVLIDRTNLTKESRARFIAPAKSQGYKVLAVVARPPQTDKEFRDWTTRLAGRPGKTIPVEVLEDMQKSFEQPHPSEGFDGVIHLDNWS